MGEEYVEPTNEELARATREMRREYRLTHREQIAAHAKRYQQTHREAVNAYQRAYREAHPEKVKQWRENAARRWLDKKAEENGKKRKPGQDEPGEAWEVVS